ncbi:hypothetical protein [Viridibacillus sp. FSL H8-0123]|uniref:hypothetical protein n=1 Tax=Viridibacillus sp. FSL H8-0123 TaxID=1928922 RepID=UPI00096CEE0B|nr:hypothetical protein [Viridibacillus sp. FSL H8-0123]OMC80931.1 hypothetical protein BK130_16545 [Viridibacillus sp. FSL H8-0123]
MQQHEAINLSRMKPSTFRDYVNDIRVVFPNFGYNEKGEIYFTYADVGAVLFASGLRNNDTNITRLEAVSALRDFTDAYGERSISIKDLKAIIGNINN